MSEQPSNAEIKAILERMCVDASNDRRERIAFETRTMDRLVALEMKFNNHVIEVGTRIDQVSSRAEGADSVARQAMISHHALDVSVREEVGDVKAMLKDQNDDVERREREKREAREIESIAAKRVGERRDARLRAFAIVAAILGVAIPTAGTVYVAGLTAKTQQAAAETRQRVEQMTRAPQPPQWQNEPAPATKDVFGPPASAASAH